MGEYKSGLYFNNGVHIKYEHHRGGVYIVSVVSDTPQDGHGTEEMKKFLQMKKGNTIYLFATDELGTNRGVLFQWYAKLGFKECAYNVEGIPYYCTHSIN